MIGHVGLHELLVRSRENRGTTRIADELGAALDHAVPLSGLAGDDAAGGRHLEALLGTRLGLHLGHFALLVRMVRTRHGSPFGRACRKGGLIGRASARVKPPKREREGGRETGVTLRYFSYYVDITR